MKISRHAIERFMERSHVPNEQAAITSIDFMARSATANGKEPYYRFGNWILVIKDDEVRTVWLLY